MAKPKSGENKDLKNVKKQLHTIKTGSVKKDKNPKFKNTSVSKVALINNSKATNKNTPSQKNFQKNKDVKNNAKLNQKLKQNKQNSPNEAQNKPANKKINLTPKKKLEESDDSNSDEEDIISICKEDDTFEEDSDVDIPDILGKSLQDESDEDDEDFEEEEDDDDDDDNDVDKDDDKDKDDSDDLQDEIEDMIVKYETIAETIRRMLPEEKKENEDNKYESMNKTPKGIMPKKKENEDNKNKLSHLQPCTSEISDDDDDEDEEDDNESEEDKIRQVVETLQRNSKLLPSESDESDEDQDFEEEEDDDDNNERKIVEHKGVKMFKGVKSKIENSDEDETEDEDDDEDEDEDESEEEDNIGLEALLGQFIPDEDDDEDFSEEDEDDEDDDISDEDEDSEENDNVIKITKEKDVKAPNSKDIRKGQKQVKKEEKQLSVEKQEDIDKRTIFIDNIPKETKEAAIKKVFSKFGPINNLRFRNIIPQDPKMSKKVAAITKQIHPKVTTVVVYINYKSQESAQKALSMNGKIFQGNYIQVQIVSDKSMKKEWDSKKAVFLANLDYSVDHNTICKHFRTCGEIVSIHLVRGRETGQCKGFGYINFKDENSVMLALKLDGTEIMKRPVRVRPYVNKDNKKGRKRDCPSNNDDNPRKKSKNNLGETVAHRAKNETSIKKHKKLQKNNVKSQEERSILFQGQKADSKNKKKENKLDKKKKKMAKKLTAKSNKSVKV